MNTHDPIRDARSFMELKGVHPDLGRVFRTAANRLATKFTISDGLRTVAEQAEMFRRKASKCDGVKKISKHQTGHALDVVLWVNDKPTWSLPLYRAFAKEIKAIAAELGVKIVWGGDWKVFVDGPHFEVR